MKNIHKIIIAGLIFAVIGAMLFLTFQILNRAALLPEQPLNETAPSVTEFVPMPSSSTQTIMLMSLVDYAVPEAGKTLRNNKQADFILLMEIDSEANKVTAIQLDPTRVISFKPQGAVEPVAIPIGETFTYGSGGSDSNLNILSTVSKAANDCRIDHYLTFHSDAVCLLTEMLGGITVEADKSFESAYPEMVADGNVFLDAQNANVFFNRLTSESEDNTLHMHRQQEFIKQVYGAFSAYSGQEDFVTQLSLKLGEKMDTDLTISQMLSLLEMLQEYELEDTIRILN